MQTQNEINGVNETLGRRIKEERRKRNMTQEQLAEWVNVSDDTIKRIESGKGAKSDIAFAIAETLKVPIELLFPPQQNISTEYESRDSLSILKNIESNTQVIKEYVKK